jgi:hypothetical protein
MKTIVGIDVGLGGAVAYLDADEGELLAVFDMPVYYTQGTAKTKTGKLRSKGHIDLDKLLYMLEIPKVHFEDTLVIMEDVHTFPGQGIVSMGTLLEQKGIILGMCKVLGYDVQLISPKTWQNHFELKCPKEIKGKDARKRWLKMASRHIATLRFPQEWGDKFIDSEAHGRSDACLMAQYAYEMQENTP